MNILFGFMKNNRTHLENVQSGLLGFCKLGTMTKSNFGKWNLPRKVCIWIHHDLQTDTLKVFLEENIGVQSIHLNLSYIWSYDVSNRGSNQSALSDTSKKFEIPFRIAFKNCSKGFIKS